MHLYSTAVVVNKDQVEGGRLTHIALIEILQKARLAFLKTHGMYEDCIVPGVGLVIGELHVRYAGAAREGDKLTISLNIDAKTVAQKKCALVYDVKTFPENIPIATASTVIVFVDMKQEKATAIPNDFLKIRTTQSMKAPDAFFKKISPKEEGDVHMPCIVSQL